MVCRHESIHSLSIALLATLVTFLAVRASSPESDPPRAFGLLGITAAETARLNVVVPAGASVPGTAPQGCRVAFSFLNADGQVLRQDVKTILPGRAASLELPGTEAFLPPGPIRSFRADIRPSVEVVTPQSSSSLCQIVTTFEVFDGATGRTTIFADPPPVGDRITTGAAGK